MNFRSCQNVEAIELLPQCLLFRLSENRRRQLTWRIALIVRICENLEPPNAVFFLGIELADERIWLGHFSTTVERGKAIARPAFKNCRQSTPFAVRRF